MPTRITIGVCGGIAAYRAVELVRLLQKEGFDPHVAMTTAAEEFIRPLTFAAISGHRVITSLWTGTEVPEGDSSIEHIGEAQTTQALILLPATAHTLARMAAGLADDFLMTLYLATKAPVIVAPAMNVHMWEHPAVQANLRTLREREVTVVEPGSGYLACGMTGSGRLADLPDIVAALRQSLRTKDDLAGETILITAGGTREPIDAVRFLGNRSSGRMGYALAEEALSRGAHVLLVTAATALSTPQGAEIYPVTTTAEMRSVVLAQLPRATVVLKAAAVADFRPTTSVTGKLLRSGSLTLQLEPTEDIVAELALRKTPGTIVVAFAAEIGSDAIARGREKMLRKGVDAIVINDVGESGIGFDGDQNAGTMLLGSKSITLPKTSKREMARRILDQVALLRP